MTNYIPYSIFPIQERGFTLIETLIAVTILSLAVAGPLTTASRAIVAAQTARDQLTASYLAQEGLEYVRAMRDKEFLSAYSAGLPDTSDAAWDTFLNGGGVGSIVACKTTEGETTTGCTLDPALPMGSALQACSGGSCTPLYLANGIYTQQSGIGEQTSFTRIVRIFNATDTYARVESTVFWSFHGTPYSVRVSDSLVPWQ